MYKFSSLLILLFINVSYGTTRCPPTKTVVTRMSYTAIFGRRIPDTSTMGYATSTMGYDTSTMGYDTSTKGYVTSTKGYVTSTKEYATSTMGYDTYLIGGKKATPQQFPHQVSLIEKSTDSFFCGGSIITAKHIVTAAHCFCEGPNFKAAEEIVIRAGSITFGSDDAKEYEVKRTMCHPKYNDTYKYYDVAMLALVKKFVYNPHIKRIRIMKGYNAAPDIISENLNVIISGWGSDKFEDAETSKYLQYIQTLTISLKTCRKMLEQHGLASFVKNWNFCTYHDSQQRTCVGDSGGPVVFQGQLMGLVSWSKKCDEKVPGIHTNIAHFSSWVRRECKKELKHGCPHVR